MLRLARPRFMSWRNCRLFSLERFRRTLDELLDVPVEVPDLQGGVVQRVEDLGRVVEVQLDAVRVTG